MKYEYKIDTPAVWLSAFDGCVSLLIDEQGLIYNGADEDKTAPNAIGQFDFEIGRVYGKDFQDMTRQPIGWLKQSGDGTELYTEHDAEAKPVLYIEKNRTFTYEEYQSMLREREAVLQKEPQNLKKVLRMRILSLGIAVGIAVVSIFVMRMFNVEIVGVDDFTGGVIALFAGIGLIIGIIKASYYSDNEFYTIEGIAATFMTLGTFLVDVCYGDAEYTMKYTLVLIGVFILGLLLCAIPAFLCSLFVEYAVAAESAVYIWRPKKSKEQ